MDHDGHGAYPVVDAQGRCVAIIAREDILELDDTASDDPAIEHASTDVVTVLSSASLVVALQLLLDEGIGHLPVVDNGRLVGMCTRTDILRARQRRFDDENLQPGWRQGHITTGGQITRITRTKRPPRSVDTPKEGIVHHYLIVGNQTLSGSALTAIIAARLASGPSRFYVLVPATPPHDLFSNVLHALEGEPPDDDQAHRVAEQRLAAALTWIRDNGGRADGQVGPGDPLRAIADVLEEHHFDEIIISTLPAHLSKWLHHDLPTRVAHAFSLPVTHVAASHADAE